MQEEKLYLTFSEALKCLKTNGKGKDKAIHTFRLAGIGLIGADWEYIKILKAMKKYQKSIEVGGNTCQSMNHGIAFKDDVSYVFVETNPIKLNKLIKSKENGVKKTAKKKKTANNS